MGAAVRRGDSFGEVESTKSVSDVYAPVSGTVVAVNAELAADRGEDWASLDLAAQEEYYQRAKAREGS